MSEKPSDEILATLHASPGRRFIGLGFLVFLGCLVAYLGFSEPVAFGWKAFLILLGLAMLWLAQVMWHATGLHLELTETELRDSSGTVLARVADIERVNRGAFATKPSNGFTIKTHRPQARGWRPGIWWRVGTRIGVGGVTPGSHAKYMADTIAALLVTPLD